MNCIFMHSPRVPLMCQVHHQYITTPKILILISGMRLMIFPSPLTQEMRVWVQERCLLRSQMNLIYQVRMQGLYLFTFNCWNCTHAELRFLKSWTIISSHIGCQIWLALASFLVLPRLELRPTMQGTVIWKLLIWGLVTTAQGLFHLGLPGMFCGNYYSNPCIITLSMPHEISVLQSWLFNMYFRWQIWASKIFYLFFCIYVLLWQFIP